MRLSEVDRGKDRLQSDHFDIYQVHWLDPLATGFSNLKRLGLGVYDGYCRAHIEACLDEFVFRWNRAAALPIIFRHAARHRLRRRRTEPVD